MARRAAWAVLIAAQVAVAQPSPSALPDDSPRTPAFRRAVVGLRERLREPPPPVSAREQAEALDWMRRANPDITHVLVGHHVVVAATDGFAERARRCDFVLNFDLGFEVLRHLWGVDPTARVGRRFMIWPDPDMAGGHSCNGNELRIAVGRGDRDNAEWFDRFFHEMTHGFQFGHPAGHLMINGFFEGWAEFMQAAVCDHLAPLGEPFAGRYEWYSGHFPAVARTEYLQTRLPIEEIVAYDPSAGLLIELVNSGRDGRADWRALRQLLQDPIDRPRWTPWHLWPALMAHDCMSAFGEERARPILARYRFPLDPASLAAATSQDSGAPRPSDAPRAPVLGEAGWVCIGPIANPERRGPEWDPLAAEDLAWRWREVAPGLDAPPIDPALELHWRAVAPDARGMFALDGPAGEPAYFYLAATLPDSWRTPLTLFVSSDDDVALWLDGEPVHFFRGNRACTPDNPDVAYADATGTRGQLVALVVNHGGPAALSIAAAEGGLLFDGFEERLASPDSRERAAAVAYLASRRHQQPARRMLGRADADPAVRAAARWWPDHRPRDPAPHDRGSWAEAEDAYSRGTIVGGFFGNNAGSSGNQCVARHWGGNPDHWLSLPLEATADAPHRVRIRYACPNEATLRVRIRRGDRVVFTSPPQRLGPTGRDWTAWGWHDLPTSPLERGMYRVDLIEPAGLPDIDLVGLVPTRR